MIIYVLLIESPLRKSQKKSHFIVKYYLSVFLEVQSKGTTLASDYF